MIVLKPVVVHENAQVLRAAWSADGKIVATVSIRQELDGGKNNNGPSLMLHSIVKLWDAKTGKLVKSLGEEEKTYIAALAFSPDKKYAAIAGNRLGKKTGSFVRIYDAEKWEIKQELDDLPGGHVLAFSPDGKTLAIGGSWYGAEKGKGSYVALWDVAGEKMKVRPKFAPPGVGVPPPGGNQAPPSEWHLLCLTFAPDGKAMAAGEFHMGSERAKIQLYDGETGKPKQELDLGKLDRPRPFQAAFTADGKNLVTACGSLKIWDVNTGKVRKTLDAKGLVAVLLSVSPDGRRLAACGFREGKDKVIEEILLCDAKTGEGKQTLTWQNDSIYIRSIAFSPDGKSLVVTGASDADVRVKGSENTKGELRIVPLAR